MSVPLYEVAKDRHEGSSDYFGCETFSINFREFSLPKVVLYYRVMTRQTHVNQNFIPGKVHL
jgi:hypothetical protein